MYSNNLTSGFSPSPPVDIPSPLLYIIHDINDILYRVSLKKGTFLVFCLFSVLEVGFYFFACVSESEFRARFI